MLPRLHGRLFWNYRCSSVLSSRCSSSAKGTTSLATALPGLPTVHYVRSSPSKVAGETRVSTLSNGLRVASENKFGQFCTVGVCIDSGSRYEVNFVSGVSHFLEKLAFASTQNFTNRDHIMQKLEAYGGICDCQSTRDTFLYASSIDRRGVETAINILAETTLRANITAEEVEFAKAAVLYELEDAELKPDQATLLQENIHAAAFRHNTLGLPKLCPKSNVANMRRELLQAYLATLHVPQRMVVAGVGVGDHDQFVKMVEKHFCDAKEPENKSGKLMVDNSRAQYTGGVVLLNKDLSQASLGPTPMPELAHFALGLEAVSHQHEDFAAFCVLNALMGGGGSFSAGGPGKGMYTRLYTQVLNRHHWMYSAQANLHAYADAGLFTVSSSGPPERLGDLVTIIARELALVASGEAVSDEEHQRAKKQVQSLLLMNLEQRPVVFEDVARQVLAQNERKPPKYYLDLIDSVKKSDLVRVADRMLNQSRPAVAAIGSLDHLPSVREIESVLLGSSNDRSLKSHT